VVLKGIKELLEDSGLDLTCIYYLTAYVKTMESFQKFNGVYSKFFSFPNPPSRVCVELADQDCGLKIAFKGTLNKKKCTHVQSISSWAPASIGPYSQSYLINNSLHLAGSIPLIPESMTLAKAEDSVDQCVNNCAAVARINEFSLESSDVCLVYYTSEKPVVRQDFFPFYIKVTSLPRGAPVELEMHLEKNLPASVNETFQHRTTEWSGRLLKKHCIDLVNLTWFVEIDEVSHLEGLLNSLESQLQDYFNSVKHKSSVTKGQLLGSEDIQLSFKDYLNEIRIYDPCPDKFKGFKTWIDEGPTIFLHSSTSAIFIKLQDFLQINTYQFINSGN
jgi:enamine deaminase RidA (YjgF/YER057c/UK114 family)